MDLSKLVRASVFAAVSVGLGFSLLMIPNVEFISIVVFISGVTLGIGWGIVVGGTAEFIFSTLNPFGSGLLFPPLLLGQVLGMITIGAAGGLLRPLFFRKTFSVKIIFIAGVFGFILTFIFDSLTTLSYPLSAGYDWPQTLALYLSGLAFTLLHQISNAIIFSVGIPGIMRHLV
jgi:hypothetical protein